MNLLSYCSKILLISIILLFSNSTVFAENVLISSAQQSSIYSSKSYSDNIKSFGIGDSVYIVIDDLSSNDLSAKNFTDNGETISAQVVQLLSNGNLLIQGKKTVINNDKRISLIITGIVNPKSITKSGQILSKNINQMKISYLGDKTVQTKDSLVNKLMKHLL